MAVVQAGDLVVLLHPDEWRSRDTGLLRNAPLILVACYSAEQDMIELKPTDWAVAAALAPDKFADIGADLKRVRDAIMDGRNRAPTDTKD